VSIVNLMLTNVYGWFSAGFDTLILRKTLLDELER
jgi:hypothetical protein